jgi:hypothetical protein
VAGVRQKVHVFRKLPWLRKSHKEVRLRAEAAEAAEAVEALTTYVGNHL